MLSRFIRLAYALRDTPPVPGDEWSSPISIFADGEIVSSPLNPNKDSISLVSDVTNLFTVTLPDWYCNGYCGMPIECEFETLDIEAQDARTLTDAKKLINAVGVGLMETRGGFYGIPDQELSNMTEIMDREDDNVNNQTGNFNGHITVNIPSEWTEHGRISIKHVDPAPISILSVYPKGISGD
jgi:hypothetical protein